MAIWASRNTSGAPLAANSHAKIHGQLKELHIPSWTTARPCLRPPDVFMRLGLRACCAPFLPVGDGCPAPRSARLASAAYVTRAIPAREATKPQRPTRHRTGSGGTVPRWFLLDVTLPPSRDENQLYNPSFVISSLVIQERNKKKVFGILPLHRYLTSQGQGVTPF
ncbi:hypothetical protein V8C35DRAFT_186976 [Trichoderma chlorosporum]